uniref:Galectin n=1 Tax=Panagrellus redivivus TaxID=6233 RepID=A0A7E4ZTF3_PANRE
MYVGGRTTFNMPYTGHIPKGAFINRDVIIFRGVPGDGGFLINIYNTDTDIVLQIKANFAERYVTWNSRINGTWAEEIRGGGFQFAADREFKMFILNNGKSITTYVDNKMLTEYIHDISGSECNTLEIKDDVSIRDLAICRGKEVI